MKNLIPISIVIAAFLIAGAFVYVNQGKGEEKVSGILSPQEAAEKAIAYINQNLLQGGATASLVNATEENGIYKFWLKIGEQEFVSYVTKDGKILFPEEGISLEETPVARAPETETPQSPSESVISPEELTKFIGCLKKAEFVIYGANWCGWTKKLVEMLGGWDMVKPIYVECTEKTEICEEKGVTGYPTVLIKEEKYQGDRTFEEIAAATDCEVPPGAESVSGESSGGGGCQ